MELLFENAFAFLNPMTAGSGTHLKIMRALSYGLPIISSSVGLRGFSEEEIKDTLLIAENDDEIIEAIHALGDKKFYDAVSKRTQKLSEPYIWTSVQQQFNEVVNEMLDDPEVFIEDVPKESILIYSIIRNNEKYIDRYYAQIKDTVTKFTDYDFYLSIYENDSTDLTKKKLLSKDWSFTSGVSIISENIDTQHFGSVKSEERVKNLAHARNKAIEAAGFLNKVDYVLMTEGDNVYYTKDIQSLLSFKEKEPGFDIVSAISIRDDGTHYDWWATRTGPIYQKGSSEIPRNFKNLSYDKYYSTSNGLCLYRAKPFQEGVRYGWINLETGNFDCEMVVVCQEFQKRGYDNIYINYEARSYHKN